MSQMGQEGALPANADDPHVEELLAHWDELPSTLRGNIEEHPVHGPRLQHLRRAEALLLGAICPQSGEIYDFARGPGYLPLKGVRRQEIEDHLLHCHECEKAVESLENSPPLPLDLNFEQAPRAHPSPTGAQAFERWLPIAAAAGVLAMGLVFLGGGTVDAGDRWPSYPLLRGPAADALAFPRDRVLGSGSLPLGAWAEEPRFEVEPVPGATHYRVTVKRHGGDAFGEGAPVMTIRGGLDDLRGNRDLKPGHYTWEAWTTVDGLERLLGERDFEIVEAPLLRSKLEQASLLECIHDLHEAGHWTDARALARMSPQSPDRDAYLGAAPGR